MTPKLTYFSIPGKAEFIRYMLHYGGIKFEDIRYDHKKWPIKEVKDSLPFGQFPIYEENGRTINQSMAIARYVASQTGLLPGDAWEQARLDAAVLNIYDFSSRLTNTLKEKDEEIKMLHRREHVFFFLSRFEEELIAGNGYFGGKLSWADFVLVGTIVGLNQFLGITVEKDYPAVSTLIAEISALPGVKEYIANMKTGV